MKIKLNYTITFTRTVDTQDAGYTKPNDPAACAEDEMRWLKEGNSSIEEHLEFSDELELVTIMGQPAITEPLSWSETK